MKQNSLRLAFDNTCQQYKFTHKGSSLVTGEVRFARGWLCSRIERHWEQRKTLTHVNRNQLFSILSPTVYTINVTVTGIRKYQSCKNVCVPDSIGPQKGAYVHTVL